MSISALKNNKMSYEQYSLVRDLIYKSRFRGTAYAKNEDCKRAAYEEYEAIERLVSYMESINKPNNKEITNAEVNRLKASITLLNKQIRRVLRGFSEDLT